MNFQDQWIKILFYQGYEATMDVVTGTDCPCAYEYGTYDPEWHRDNPSAEDCNGTLKIVDTTTTYNIKAIFTNKIESMVTYLTQFNIKEIGKITDFDQVMFGTVNIDDLSFINLSNLHTDEDKLRSNVTITIDSDDFFIDHVYDMKVDVLVGQVALLKRKA